MSTPPTEATATAAPTPAARPKLRLGDVLVQQKLVSEEQLQQMLQQQRTSGRRLGRLMIDAGLITEEALAHALARQLRVPVVNLKSFPLETRTVRLLGESPARRHRAIVLEDKGEQLLVGFADPLDLAAYDELTRLLGRSIRVAVVAETQLAAALDRHYRRTEEMVGLAKALEQDLGDAVDFGTLQQSVGQEGAPVVRLLQSVFEDALQVGASDVHLEPQESGLMIRSRVDGVLQTQTQADKRIAAALSQRLKLMAGLDISEKRLPQDGRFSLRLRERSVDVRLSTLPTHHGESVVMRLLGQGDGVRKLDAIGMPADMLTRFREILGRASGMVLRPEFHAPPPADRTLAGIGLKGCDLRDAQLAGCDLRLECTRARLSPGEWEPEIIGDVMLLHRGDQPGGVGVGAAFEQVHQHGGVDRDHSALSSGGG